MSKLTGTYDIIVSDYNDVIDNFESSKVLLNEACIEYIDNVDIAKSDELMDASILKKKMKNKVMEVLIDDSAEQS